MTSCHPTGISLLTVQICPNPSQSVPNCSILSKLVQNLPNAFKSVPFNPKPAHYFKPIPIRSNSSHRLQIRPNPSQTVSPFQIHTKLFKTISTRFHTCPNQSKASPPFQIHTTPFKPVSTHPNPSHLFKPIPTSSKPSQPFQIRPQSIPIYFYRPKPLFKSIPAYLNVSVLFLINKTISFQ